MTTPLNPNTHRPKELLQTVMSLACAAPKEVTLSVTISGGLPYSFSSAVNEMATSLSEGSADPTYVDTVTAKMAVLNAATATVRFSNFFSLLLLLVSLLSIFLLRLFLFSRLFAFAFTLAWRDA